MDYLEEQREEVESLKSIFPNEFSEINAFPPIFMIRIDDLDISKSVTALQLKICFPPKYPDEIPSIEIPNRSNAMPEELLEELITFLQNSCKEYIGMPMIFGLIDLTKEWMKENSERFKGLEKRKSDSDEECNEEELTISQRLKDRCDVINAKGGKWNFVIGLIGKYPSNLSPVLWFVKDLILCDRPKGHNHGNRRVGTFNDKAKPYHLPHPFLDQQGTSDSCEIGFGCSSW